VYPLHLSSELDLAVLFLNTGQRLLDFHSLCPNGTGVPDTPGDQSNQEERDQRQRGTDMTQRGVLAAAEIDRLQVLPSSRRKRRDRRQRSRRRRLVERHSPGLLSKSRPHGDHVQIKLLGERRRVIRLPLFAEHIQAPKRWPRMGLLIELER